MTFARTARVGFTSVHDWLDLYLNPELSFASYVISPGAAPTRKTQRAREIFIHCILGDVAPHTVRTRGERIQGGHRLWREPHLLSEYNLTYSP